jgi:hypothetical protein
MTVSGEIPLGYFEGAPPKLFAQLFGDTSIIADLFVLGCVMTYALCKRDNAFFHAVTDRVLICCPLRNSMYFFVLMKFYRKFA